MKFFSFLGLALIIVAMTSLCGCAEKDARHPPKHVILITSCTTRWDAMGFNGSNKELTPNLDALASDGVAFTNCISQAPWTKPSVASILSGLTPNVHKLDDFYPGKHILTENFRPNRVLSDEVYMVAEFFSDHDYPAIGRIANIHASSDFNLAQGFDEYVWPKGRTSGVSFTDESIKVLEKHKDTKLFLFHLPMDAHTYNPPIEYYERIVRKRNPEMPAFTKDFIKNFRKRNKALLKKALGDHKKLSDEDWQTLRDLYDAEILYLDYSLGKLFEKMKELGIYDEAVIIFSADHGEEFNEHDFFAHQLLLYDTLVRIPLIIKVPGISPRHIDQQVRNIDIFPTLVELISGPVDEDDDLMGRSLLPLMQGKKEKPLPAISSDSRTGDALRYDGYKLIQKKNSVELYDLRKDPHEKHNIADKTPSIRSRMEKMLKNLQDKELELRESYPPSGSIILDKKILDELEAIGYIGP